MKAPYKKKILQDQNGNFENFLLVRDVPYCCERFQSHCKKFTCWDYEKGKFSIIDNITYEGHSSIVIDFCPFCGEKIEYENLEMAKKIIRKKK